MRIYDISSPVGGGERLPVHIWSPHNMCLFINSASARGLASTADRNEIYGNLNVNGSQHFFFYVYVCVGSV